MFCTQCGNPNPEGANNCTFCGAQLVNSSAEPTANTQQNNSTTVLNQDSFSTSSYDSIPSFDSFQTPSYSSYQAPTQEYNNYQNIPTVEPQKELPANAMSIVSMILGIVSVALVATVLCCYYTLGVLPLGLGIAAAILGGIAKSKAKAVGMKNGKANAGFTCGIISVIIVAGCYALVVVGYICMILGSAL